jgi:hypothetical protein
MRCLRRPQAGLVMESKGVRFHRSSKICLVQPQYRFQSLNQGKRLRLNHPAQCTYCTMQARRWPMTHSESSIGSFSFISGPPQLLSWFPVSFHCNRPQMLLLCYPKRFPRSQSTLPLRAPLVALSLSIMSSVLVSVHAINLHSYMRLALTSYVCFVFLFR